MSGLSDAYCQAAVQEAHNKGRKILICVGGAGTGDSFVVASNNTNRANFITNIVNFMKKYNYDGVDMDWEELRGANASYVTLHKELRAELEKITPRPLLTVAMADYLASVCGQIYTYVDQMNAMSYWTNAGGMNGFMSPLLSAGIPKKILGVGMGLDPADNEIDQDSSSCRAKCQYALNNGYGGVMTWDISGAANKLLCYQAIAKYVPLASTPVLVCLRPYSGQQQNPLIRICKGQSGMLEIVYTVPQSSNNSGVFADVSIFDVRGALVQAVRHGNTVSGTYRMPLLGNERSTLSSSSGAYIIKLSTEKGNAIAKANILN
jgi:hypothetical protein